MTYNNLLGKRVLFVIFAMLVSVVPVIAQSMKSSDYVPLVRENVRWEYLYNVKDIHSDESSETPFWIEIKGDTTITGTDYKKCIAWSEQCDTTVLGLIREDVSSKRVYLYDSFAENHELLLYDFNDIENSWGLQWLSLSDYDITIEQCQLSAGNAKCHKFSETSDKSSFFCIIEGIGFVSNGISKYSGYLLNYQTDNGENRNIVFKRLLDTKNDSVIYDQSATITNIPIDSEVLDFTFDGKKLSTPIDALIEVIDLNGRHVVSSQGKSISIGSLPQGLYIAKATASGSSAVTKILIE